MRKRRSSSEASRSPASSATARRSARRRIARATSSWAESWVPPGITNFGRQLDPVHVAVDQLLELVGHLGGDPADAVVEPLGRLGRGRELGAGDEEVVLEAQDVGGELGVARARRASGRRRAPRPPRRARRRPRCGRRTWPRGRRTRARSCRRRPSSCRSGSLARPYRVAPSSSGLKTMPVSSLGKK